MKKILIAILFLFSITACKKVLEPRLSDTGQQSAAEFFVNYNGALQAINGVYASLREPYKRQWVIDEMSDDASNNGFEFELLNLNSGLGNVSHLWNTWFSTVQRANTFIERAPGIQGLQGNQNILRNQFVGEAYFIRALAYFNLTQLFGDVPLVTGEIKNVSELSVGRTPVQQVYAQIEADLLEALKTVPVRHSNPTLIQPVVGISGGTEVGRATSGSVRALLGHLYLTLNQPAKAETVLQEIVNSGVYSLQSSYAANFNALGGGKNNSESVFEIQYTNGSGFQHDLSFQFGPVEDGNSLGMNRPTDATAPDGININLNNHLAQAFPAGDLRKAASIKYSPGVSGSVRTIAAKYWVQGGSNQGSTNWPVYRYADVLLMLAEALQAQNKDAQALTYLNQVHAHPRTGLTAYTGLTGTALRDAIRLERRLELNLEMKRWWDLRRWGILSQVMTAHGRTLAGMNANGLLPVPATEIQRNPKFTQNQGY
jgi:hypothetical protein